MSKRYDHGTTRVKRALRELGTLYNHVSHGQAVLAAPVDLDLVLNNLDSLLDQGFDVTVHRWARNDEGGYIIVDGTDTKKTSGGFAHFFGPETDRFGHVHRVYQTRTGRACGVSLKSTRAELASLKSHRRYNVNRAERIRNGEGVYRNRNGLQTFWTVGGYITATQLFQGLVQPAIIGLPGAPNTAAVYAGHDLDPATGRGYFPEPSKEDKLNQLRKRHEQLKRELAEVEHEFYKLSRNPKLVHDHDNEYVDPYGPGTGWTQRVYRTTDGDWTVSDNTESPVDEPSLVHISGDLRRHNDESNDDRLYLVRRAMFNADIVDYEVDSEYSAVYIDVRSLDHAQSFLDHLYQL